MKIDRFQLAKVLYDARVDYSCGKIFKDIIPFEKAKFPEGLKQHQYVVPQTYIDFALAEADAAIRFFQQIIKEQNNDPHQT